MSALSCLEERLLTIQYRTSKRTTLVSLSRSPTLSSATVRPSVLSLPSLRSRSRRTSTTVSTPRPSRSRRSLPRPSRMARSTLVTITRSARVFSPMSSAGMSPTRVRSGASVPTPLAPTSLSTSRRVFSTSTRSRTLVWLRSSGRRRRVFFAKSPCVVSV